ncbi:MAG: YggT family protein [Hahellaceae bacterium]|nr:YggT family protein [Hahellaceae bacterium]
MQLLLDLVQIIGSLYITLVLLRFILQVCRADFYNPISQFIVKATNPLLIPLRRVIPSIRGLDSASLVLALLLQIILVLVINQIPLGHLGEIFGQVLAAALIQLLNAVVQLYTWALIIIVIISWVAPGSYHPGAQLLAQITEPLLAPIRRILPPMGGLDLSPMVLMLVLFVIGGALSGRYG